MFRKSSFFDNVPAIRVSLNLSQSGYYLANQLIATFGLIRIGVGTTNKLETYSSRLRLSGSNSNNKIQLGAIGALAIS